MILSRLFRIALTLGLLALTWHGAAADTALIERTQATVKAVQADLVGHESDFDTLLELRARIDPLRDDLSDLVATLGKKRLELDARLSDLGTPPSDPATPEPESIQKTRHDLQTAFATVDAAFKQARLTLAGVDTLWTQLSDLRRDAFAKRIFEQGESPLTHPFWSKFVMRGLPVTETLTHEVYDEEIRRVVEDGTAQTVLILFAVAATLAVLFVALHRWLARRASASTGARADRFDRSAAIRHAFFVLVMRTLPLPLMFALFDAAVEYFELSSDVVDLLLERVAIAVLMIGVSRGIMAALLSPRNPRWRLIACSDETAGCAYDTTILATNVFVVGILLTAYEDTISAPVSVLSATSLFVALGVILAFALGLFRLRNRPAATPPATGEAAHDTDAAGPVVLSLGWVRPLVVLALLAGLVALATGYVALAGFLMTRLTIVVLVVSLAILLSLFIEEFFGGVLSSRSATGRAVAHAVGLRPDLLDLIATTLAGMLRLVIVCVTLIFAFGPWGIRFGDINPFNDALFAFSFAYIRFSLGTVAFALLTFVVGLLGTRLIVAWLDRRLLPLTALDPGVRNSMTTVLGYVGFAVTVAFVLSQLGVNPQNLTVVAGALSVGIGFGLQAITSNFISGLIVLAERPIRVGDIVAVKGEEGRVKKISVRSTLIGGFDRTDIIVPNTDILTSIVRNKSLSDRQARIKITILVDQDADQDAVARIMLASANGQTRVLKDPAPAVFFTKASEAGLEFELRAFIDDLDAGDRARSDMHFAIMRAFRSEGIRLASVGAAVSPAAAPALKTAGG